MVVRCCTDFWDNVGAIVHAYFCENLNRLNLDKQWFVFIY